VRLRIIGTRQNYFSLGGVTSVHAFFQKEQ